MTPISDVKHKPRLWPTCYKMGLFQMLSLGLIFYSSLQNLGKHDPYVYPLITKVISKDINGWPDEEWDLEGAILTSSIPAELESPAFLAHRGDLIHQPGSSPKPVLPVFYGGFIMQAWLMTSWANGDQFNHQTPLPEAKGWVQISTL